MEDMVDMDEFEQSLPPLDTLDLLRRQGEPFGTYTPSLAGHLAAYSETPEEAATENARDRRIRERLFADTGRTATADLQPPQTRG